MYQIVPTCIKKYRFLLKTSIFTEITQLYKEIFLEQNKRPYRDGAHCQSHEAYWIAGFSVGFCYKLKSAVTQREKQCLRGHMMAIAVSLNSLKKIPHTGDKESLDQCG